MPKNRKIMTDAERAELPSSLFLLSGSNFLRRGMVWFSRWILFEWIIILTIIGKPPLRIKWRILSRISSEQSGKNEFFGIFLLGFKYTLRTCFESKNFLPKSCPELSNQVLSFSEGQIY